jgi:mono/diheme cytochrome c family protein
MMNTAIRYNRACAIAVVLVAAITAGCYPVRRAEPIVGPMTLNEPTLERGRLLFDRHCYKCHTEGEGGLGPILNDKPLPKFLMRLQTRVGLGAMPRFTKEQISDDELDDLLAYIVALRHHYSKQ